MNKDIERVVIGFDGDRQLVVEKGSEEDIMKEINDMEGIDVVFIQFRDEEVVNYTTGLLLCDIGEIHKGVSTPNIHMSSCLTKEEAIKEIKELIGGTT